MTRTEMGRPRIAVAYFGITRALEYTLPSLQQNLLKPARRYGDVTVYAHLFDQKYVDNPRSGEKGVLDPEAYTRLMLDHLELEPPHLCLEARDFEAFKAMGDCWQDEFKSLRNLIHQLHSLDCVSTMVLESGADVCIFARPDLRYLDSLNYLVRAAIKPGTPRVWLPDWLPSGGLNDRFAVCRGAQAIAAYGGRIARAKDFCAAGERALHSEQLVAYALEQADIPVTLTTTRAQRVRVDGSVPKADPLPGLARGYVKVLRAWRDRNKMMRRLRGLS